MSRFVVTANGAHSPQNEANWLDWQLNILVNPAHLPHIAVNGLHWQ